MEAEARQAFETDGALHLLGAARPVLTQLLEVLQKWPDGEAGTRIAGDPQLGELLREPGVIASLVSQLCGESVFPVRAIYFDKNDVSNWALGWHQDRTIAVKAQHDLPGFGPWTRKQGILHVQPPFEIVEALRTVRIHFDPVPADNGPLLVVPGSHRLGPVAAERANAIAEGRVVLTCLAEVGDVWVYHTPILHASNRSKQGQRRRVLQVDYASAGLPLPLQWLGI
jgi:ectoine hydroxylase-related dioxygenase (phytanoyl-CoA dioxygenase family)